jgi:hypothetical protein
MVGEQVHGIYLLGEPQELLLIQQLMLLTWSLDNFGELLIATIKNGTDFFMGS